MARVSGVLECVTLEADEHGSSSREREPLPRVEALARSSAPLDPTDGRPRDASQVPELPLRQSPSLPGLSELRAEAGGLFNRPAVRLGRELRSLERWHDRVMVAPSAYLALSRR